MSYNNIFHNKPYRKQSLDLTSNGVIPLIQELLQSGFAVRIKVSGHSMLPYLKGNEVVTMQKVPAVMLKKGDLILFMNNENIPVLHRIVRLKNKSDKKLVVQTKGDGILGLDAPVDASRILACVKQIEVKKNSSTEKPLFSRIDLTLFRHQTHASYIANRELIRYYFYRLKKTVMNRKAPEN